MGKHATIGRSLTGHKNTTLKQASKYYSAQRVRNAPDMASEVHVETFEPLPAIEITHASPFPGINPIAGQEFTRVGNMSYRLRVREGYIGLKGTQVKPKDGKAFTVWVASYAGRQVPLLTNKGQALRFADAKDKLFALLMVQGPSTRYTRITPADPKVKNVKDYTGGEISRFVIYAQRDGRKIRYVVPEGKTSGEIIDDMTLKGYTIDKIGNA